MDGGSFVVWETTPPPKTTSPMAVSPDKTQIAKRKVRSVAGDAGLFGQGIQGGVEAVGFGEFGLSGFGVVEAEQGHSEIEVGVREIGIEANGLAVAGGGVLIFSGVEESGALIETEIGIVGLEGNQFLVSGNGIIELIGGKLAIGEADQRVGEVGFLGVGFLVVGRGFGVVLLVVGGVPEIVEGVEVVGLEGENSF